MPLVSGVCRMASAPMLSHGGSRLNASKPEANPKTRCPTQEENFGDISHRFRGKYVSFAVECSEGRSTQQNTNLSNRHSRNCGLCSPRRRKVHHIITRLSSTNDQPDAFHTPNAGNRNPRDTQKQPTITSLSKRENMHGLA